MGVHFDKMKMEYIVRNIHRLEWAAETTPDYLWRKAHLLNRKNFIEALLKRFSQ